MTEGTMLGHKISQQGLQVDPNNIAIIQRLPPPQKVRDVRSFLGLLGYSRRFIKDLSKLASPLFGLLGKDVEFIWTDNCQEALDALKGKLVITPILRDPNWALPFHIHIDSSNKAIGAALDQVEETLPYAIYFVSKTLSKEKLNYTIIEKELLAVVHSLNKFRHYVTSYQTFVHIDHAAIRYLMNKPNVNTHIIRWLLLLQQFDLTIVDKPGKENVVAYFLSRLDLPIGEEGMVDDQMPNEHLFAISIISPWFSDIENYLVSAQFPPHLFSKEKSKIVRKSAPFTWIGGNLFKLGPDQILRRWVRVEEVFDILLTSHDGPCGGHFPAKRTAFKFCKQVEVTSRALEGILTKVVSSSRKYWADHLVEATFAYNTTWKTTTGFTPYELVYGKKALLSIKFEYNTSRMAAQLDLDLSHAQKERLLQLNGLDEQIMQALLHSEVVQLQRKIWHDIHLKEKQF
eukprot:PITA_36103